MPPIDAASKWETIYQQVPLREVPRHFAGIRDSPFTLEYLGTVLKLCPIGGRTLDTGSGSGYGPVWLSLRGVRAEGIDLSAQLVERAGQVNSILGGAARFRSGDLFQCFEEWEYSGRVKYDVIHHQGVLEHFAAPWIRAALAQQAACANHVVFSVPSVYYPFDPEFGDERLMPLEEWRRLLEPFDVADLRPYGDPQHGRREHILCVLRGHDTTPEWRAMMHVPEEPYPDGISAVVHTRNEEGHIEDCLRSLQGVADEIIVCDMESEDRTVAVARELGAEILEHPRIANFDRARNVSAMRAKYRWVLFLDADERVPPRLGSALLEIVNAQATGQAEPFAGMLLPFRHHFAGKWMQCLYPGYTAPRLLKNGHFSFNARLHSGAEVSGPVARFPANDPKLALVHYSYRDVSHYVSKVNGYTDAEAANMHRDGRSYHWQSAVRHFLKDFQYYYDLGAPKDGTHGFLYSFLSGFYRFEQHAKLYERRYQEGRLSPPEEEVPASLEEMLEFALSVVREKPLPAPSPLRVEETEVGSAPDLAWSGPLLDPSGYGEECRNFVFGLDALGYPVSAQVVPWSRDEVDMAPEVLERLSVLAQRPVSPGFIHVSQNLAPALGRHPQAGLCVGRTMFETDRLPEAWVRACNAMDAIWVPSEFNRESFATAGVEAAKLAVLPGCLDAEHFGALPSSREGEAWRETLDGLPEADGAVLRALDAEAEGAYRFLAVFDWTLHKGWDVLLRGFLRAFEGRRDVRLWVKAWSTMGYSQEQVRAQASAFVREGWGVDLFADSRIRFIPERLSRSGVEALHGLADCYVLPSRGEGWGRPYMEAMALGKPAIATNWSGNTAFMTKDNSYLLEYKIQDVPERGWREIPTFRGHRWAEPDLNHLVETLRQVESDRDEATKRGQLAREQVLERYDRRAVARLVQTEIAELQGHGSGPRPEVAESCLVQPPSRSVKPVALRWEGAQFSRHSLGHVNRELCLALMAATRNGSLEVEPSLIPTEPAEFGSDETPHLEALGERTFAPLSRPASVHVRHFFPPRLEKPAEGKFVLMQPWEYGFLPTAWLEPIRRNVDEVWCYSKYVRQVYLASGIPEEKLHVVPLGVDPRVFRPDVPPYVFTTEAGAVNRSGRTSGEGKRPFTFLFAGGTLHRKGIDILLEAYRRAFTQLDDVCLVIKDTCTNGVYRVGNEKQRILRLIEENSGPPIVYTDADLSAHQLAGLYAASNCLVQPYRGEGFCLPALEAMACGVPVIVPEGGATDDFVDETVGWRVTAERKPFAVGCNGLGRIGEWECCGPTWTLEVELDELARLMRRVAMEPGVARERGQAAAERARSWTWQRSGSIILERLRELDARARNEESDAESSRLWLPVGVEGRTATQACPTPSPAPRGEPTISLCMIVRDEERVIDDCLASAKAWFDEIILVDTGSTDRTVEIAEEHGAKVFHFPWNDSFSDARNVSLEHATGDWIFWMDADDTLPEECGRKLRELAFLAEDRLSGFMCQVHIPPKPGDSGFTIVDHVKLFRNRPEHRFVGRIHEQILEPIQRAGGEVDRSDVYVVHSGYDYSPEGQEKKRVRDLILLEKDLADRPDHPFVLFNIGMTAYYMKDFAKAVPALERCLEKSGPRESTVRKVYAMLAGCHLESGDLGKARDWLERGLTEYPRDPELLFRAGVIYREAGELERAERSYVTLLTQRERGHIDSLDVTMTGFKAHHNLALIYMDLGRYHEAERYFAEALRHGPEFEPSRAGLMEARRRTGRKV